MQRGKFYTLDRMWIKSKPGGTVARIARTGRRDTHDRPLYQLMFLGGAMPGNKLWTEDELRNPLIGDLSGTEPKQENRATLLLARRAGALARRTRDWAERRRYADARIPRA